MSVVYFASFSQAQTCPERIAKITRYDQGTKYSYSPGKTNRQNISKFITSLDLKDLGVILDDVFEFPFGKVTSFNLKDSQDRPVNFQYGSTSNLQLGDANPKHMRETIFPGDEPYKYKVSFYAGGINPNKYFQITELSFKDGTLIVETKSGSITDWRPYNVYQRLELVFDKDFSVKSMRICNGSLQLNKSNWRSLEILMPASVALPL